MPDGRSRPIVARSPTGTKSTPRQTVDNPLSCASPQPSIPRRPPPGAVSIHKSAEYGGDPPAPSPEPDHGNHVASMARMPCTTVVHQRIASVPAEPRCDPGAIEHSASSHRPKSSHEPSGSRSRTARPARITVVSLARCSRPGVRRRARAGGAARGERHSASADHNRSKVRRVVGEKWSTRRLQ
jgi:hypothetical protein